MMTQTVDMMLSKFSGDLCYLVYCVWQFAAPDSSTSVYHRFLESFCSYTGKRSRKAWCALPFPELPDQIWRLPVPRFPSA